MLTANSSDVHKLTLDPQITIPGLMPENQYKDFEQLGADIYIYMYVYEKLATSNGSYSWVDQTSLNEIIQRSTTNPKSRLLPYCHPSCISYANTIIIAIISEDSASALKTTQLLEDLVATKKTFKQNTTPKHVTILNNT